MTDSSILNYARYSISDKGNFRESISLGILLRDLSTQNLRNGPENSSSGFFGA